MKRIMIIGLTVMFIAAVPFTVLGEPKSKSASSGYAVSNPNHTQAVGGPSTHASNGLSVASQHSQAVHSTVPTVSPASPSGGTGGTTVPTVTAVQ